jgi:hypothetical protein
LRGHDHRAAGGEEEDVTDADLARLIVEEWRIVESDLPIWYVAAREETEVYSEDDAGLYRVAWPIQSFALVDAIEHPEQTIHHDQWYFPWWESMSGHWWPVCERMTFRDALALAYALPPALECLPGDLWTLQTVAGCITVAAPGYSAHRVIARGGWQVLYRYDPRPEPGAAVPVRTQVARAPLRPS